MSHFLVAVFSKEGQSVDDLLAPYDENISVNRYVKNTKSQLIEKQKQEIEDYKNSRYAVFINDPQKYKQENSNNPDHLKYLEYDFPKKLQYTDDELYNEATKYELPDDIGIDGEIYSTYNPNSKWDWHSIGGRYSGLLKLKDGATSGEYGERSWTNENMPLEYNKVDSAKIKDIDFSLNQEEYDRCIRFWEVFVEKDSPKNLEEQDFLKNNFYNENYYLEYYETKENYAIICSTFNSYAVITPDGMWHSQGEMGWFGMSSESPDEAKEWNRSFKHKFLDNADPEWFLTIVDCHI